MNHIINIFNQMTDNDSKKRQLTEEDILNENFKKQKAFIDPNDFICPITKQIFLEPVTCDDGFTYEKWAIDNILNGGSKLSPMTREPISKYFENKFVALSVNNFLKENPEFKKLQFEDMCYHDFYGNIENALHLLKYKNYKEFCKYRDIVLCTDFPGYHTVMVQIAYHCTDLEYFNKILDHSIDFNVKDDKGESPMHQIVKYMSKPFIMCAIQKGLDVHDINDNGDSVIHALLNRTSSNGASYYMSEPDKTEIIKYLIQEGMCDLSYKNKSNEIILDAIVSNLSVAYNYQIINIITDLHPKKLLSFYILSYVLLNQNHDSICAYISKMNNVTNNESIFMYYYNSPSTKNNTFSYEPLMNKLSKCVNEINDNDNLNSKEKKDITEKLIEIYTIKCNLRDIDTKILVQTYEEIYLKANEKINKCIQKWKENDDVIMN